MDTFLNQALFLGGECFVLCDELQKCFEAERLSLIELRLEDLHQTNVKKECLVRTLANKRKRMKELLGSGESSLAFDSRLQEWKERWLVSWGQLRRHCEENQEFIEHSLKNLDRIVENLKRLMGGFALYSSKGMPIDSTLPGKVVEARY